MIASGHATRMWALASPTFTYDLSLLLAGGLGPVTSPLSAYLIEHPDGLVMFDSSLDPLAAVDAEAAYGPIAGAFGLDFPPELAVDRQVEAAGFSPADVGTLVLSHVHFDHTGGIDRFPNALVVVGAEELGFAKWPSGSNQGFFRPKDLDPLWNRERELLEVPAGLDHDLFGDGSVVAISTPGHTNGHLSLVVRLEHGNYILVGDATHTRDAFAREVICPSDVDTVTAVRSVKRIKLLQHSLRATVIIGHDPEDRASLPVPPEAIARPAEMQYN